MRKRMTAIMLISILCLALAGCSNTKVDQTKDTKNETAVGKDKEVVAEDTKEEAKEKNPWSVYSGVYSGDMVYEGADGSITTRVDITGYDTSGKTTVGTLYVSGTHIDEVEIYYNGSNEIQESGTYTDVFYCKASDGFKTYFGFKKDGEELTLDEYCFLEDGDFLLLASMKPSEEGRKEIDRIWDDGGKKKEPQEINFGETVSTSTADFSIDKCEMNLSHFERPNLSIDPQSGMKVIAVYGTITNKYNKEVEIQSVYGGMQNLFIVDGNEYSGYADTDSGFMGSIQAGQTTPFALYAEVPENICANCKSCDLQIGFNEKFFSDDAGLSPDECKYRYIIRLK